MKRVANTAAPGPAFTWWIRIRVMTVKELLQLSRDAVLIVFFIYGFTLDVYLAGSGVSLELTKAAVTVMDFDRTPASRELAYRFRPPTFDVDYSSTLQTDANDLLDRGEAMVVLDIPSRFQEKLITNEPASVQIQVDAVNSALGLSAASYASHIVKEFGLEQGLRRLGLSSSPDAVPGVKSEYRVWFNPDYNNAWFMSIAELLNIITLLAMLLPAMAMVREKERGTLEQLLVSPLSPFQIMFPKVLAMAFVILLGTAVNLFCILGPVFHVPMRGSLTLFFLVTALYVFATSGLGLFISTVSKSLGQAGLFTIVIYGPMVFLSGAWTPAEAMPPLMRPMMYVSPLAHYIDVSLGILLKGAGIGLLWDSISAIAVIGGILFGLGMWRLRRQFR